MKNFLLSFSLFLIVLLVGISTLKVEFGFSTLGYMILYYGLLPAFIISLVFSGINLYFGYIIPLLVLVLLYLTYVFSALFSFYQIDDISIFEKIIYIPISVINIHLVALVLFYYSYRTTNKHIYHLYLYTFLTILFINVLLGILYNGGTLILTLSGILNGNIYTRYLFPVYYIYIILGIYNVVKTKKLT